MIHNITLFVVVMLLTVAFLREASAEPLQDPENICHLTDTCKPTGSVNNPFEDTKQ